MPEIKKKDFCCLIITGFGTGYQAGMILRDHLRENGMDAYLTAPSGKEQLKISQEHWLHGVRMEYIALCHRYERVTAIGISLGGMLLLHMQDLNPAAVVFVNTPCAPPRSLDLFRLYKADLRSHIRGVFREPHGRYELYRLARQTKTGIMQSIHCPTLILQSLDDKVCSASNADRMHKQINVQDKTLRLYAEGGHDVLNSDTVLAVCSDIFQFCSRIRGMGKQ